MTKNQNLNSGNLGRDLSVLFASTLVIGIGLFWISIEDKNFDENVWLTLIISASFGLAITIIASERTKKILLLLSKSEDDKKEFAKFILKENFKQFARLKDNYFATVTATQTTTEKQKALKIIVPSLNTFLNLCESTIPNIGNKITVENLQYLNNQFAILHRLLLILDMGTTQQFDENINKLNQYTKTSEDFLGKI